MEKKIDWISLIAVAVIITCGVVAVQVYFNMKNDSCVSNPLIYSARYYEDVTGYKFQGSGYFLMDQPSPKIFFDSEGVSVDFPEKNKPIQSFNLSNFENFES